MSNGLQLHHLSATSRRDGSSNGRSNSLYEISPDTSVFVPSRRRRLLVFAVAIAVVVLLSAATYAGYVLTGAATR